MLKPKNIIFDLGGVIVNLDFQASIDALKKFNIPNFDSFFSQTQQSDIFNRLETGAISSFEFIENIKKNIGVKDVTTDMIEDAWNKMLLDTPQAHLELLEKVKQNYHTCLLSNTNEIHIRYYINSLKKEHPNIDFYSLFHTVYLSHELKMKKPDAEIFKTVLDREGMKASETLFIDDTEKHIRSAAALGINTYWLQEKDIVNLFNENGEWIGA